MKKIIPAVAALGIFAFAFCLQVDRAEARVNNGYHQGGAVRGDIVLEGCNGSRNVCCANTTVTHI